jgi:phosphoserine aminotransferase
VYYFAPQKALAADAGVWFALCAPAAIERIERVAATGRWVPPSLSLPIALENSRLDQTYNTPPLAALFLVADTVRWILGHGGLEWSASRCDRSAEILYGWAEASPRALPFVAKPSERSRTTATIDFVDTIDAAALAATLRDNGIVDTEPYRKLGRNQLRIALFPAIEPDDVAALTRCIDYVIDAG